MTRRCDPVCPSGEGVDAGKRALPIAGRIALAVSYVCRNQRSDPLDSAGPSGLFSKTGLLPLLGAAPCQAKYSGRSLKRLRVSGSTLGAKNRANHVRNTQSVCSQARRSKEACRGSTASLEGAGAERVRRGKFPHDEPGRGLEGFGTRTGWTLAVEASRGRNSCGPGKSVAGACSHAHAPRSARAPQGRGLIQAGSQGITA